MLTHPIIFSLWSSSKKYSFSGVSVKYLLFHLKISASVFFSIYPYFKILLIENSEILSIDSRLFIRFFEFLFALILTILKSCSWVFLSSSSSFAISLGSIPSFSCFIYIKFSWLSSSPSYSLLSDLLVFYEFMTAESTRLSESKMTNYLYAGRLQLIYSYLISFIGCTNNN